MKVYNKNEKKKKEKRGGKIIYLLGFLCKIWDQCH
jgi:hypothetical protein